MFPVWLHFRGGKGVATGFGVFLVAAPLAALSSIGLFAIVLLLTRYVSLASILGAASFPVFAWFMVRGEKPAPYIAAQIIVSLLIILKHHQNIRRLATGTENRFGARTPRKEARMSRIVVLGAGAWGTAIALSLCRRGGHEVTLWAHSEDEARQIDTARENTLFLPGFPLPARSGCDGRHGANRNRRDSGLRHPVGISSFHLAAQ